MNVSLGGRDVWTDGDLRDRVSTQGECKLGRKGRVDGWGPQGQGEYRVNVSLGGRDVWTDGDLRDSW